MADKNDNNGMQALKQKIFEALNFPHSKTFLANFIALLLILSSVMGGLIVMLETDVNLKSQFFLIFKIIEFICATIFILEYILRFWSSSDNLQYGNNKSPSLIYTINFLGLIDLATATLFTLVLVLPFDNEALRIAGLYRLIVFLKLIRYSESFEIIWSVVKRKKEELLITLMLSLLLMFFGAIVMYIAEHEAQPDKFTNLFSSMWFTAINLFTIGYGEMVPVTPLGKITSAVVSVLGITLFLLPVSVIGSGFIDEIQERNPHYDVCPNCNKKVPKGAFLRDLNQKRRGRPSKIMKIVMEAQKAKKTPELTSRQQKLRKCYNLITFRFPRTLGQVIVFIFFMTFITLNVLAIMVETNPTLSHELRPTLNTVYVFSIIVFSFEYYLRVWSSSASEQDEYEDSTEGKLKYARSPLALVDLIVIVALYLMLILGQLVPPSRQYILIPLLFVVLKIGHFIDVFSVSGLIFKDTKREFLGTIFICIIFLIFSSAAIFYVENSAQPDKFSSVPATLWFGIVTFTTTGFGDIYPVTTLGRFMTVCFAFIGVALFTLPSGILGASFFSSMQEYRLHKICPNCGFILSKPKIRNQI